MLKLKNAAFSPEGIKEKQKYCRSALSDDAKPKYRVFEVGI
jgi:hypothetical protein